MANKKWSFFKILCLFTAILFIYLFLTLLLNNKTFLIDLGLEPSEGAMILARRASMFMVGISILMFGSMNLVNSKSRQIICLATGISMFGLSILGIYEFVRGTVNSSIFIAITIETFLWISFGVVFLKNYRSGFILEND